MINYYVWTSHREIKGTADNCHNHNFVVGESRLDPRLHEMVMNAFGNDNDGENQYVDQLPMKRHKILCTVRVCYSTTL